uniref:Uncharacterized protein n=1 Tax=Fagus sylvatica TaxID=28930 RepID=A0A2N9HY69_FAGSY
MPHFQAPWPKLSSLPPLKAAAPPLMVPPYRSSTATMAMDKLSSSHPLILMAPCLTGLMCEAVWGLGFG